MTLQRKKLVFVLIIASVALCMMIFFHSLNFQDMDVTHSSTGGNLRRFNNIMNVQTSDNVKFREATDIPAVKLDKNVWGKDFDKDTSIKNKESTINSLTPTSEPSASTVLTAFPTPSLPHDPFEHILTNPDNITTALIHIDYSLGKLLPEIRSAESSSADTLRAMYISGLQGASAVVSMDEEDDVLSKVHQVLSTGDPCFKEPELIKSEQVIIDIIEDLVYMNEGKLFVEVSTMPIDSSFSRHISKSSSLTSLSLKIFNPTEFKENDFHCQEYQRPLNHLLGMRVGVDVEDDVEAVDMFQCAQFIENLDMLVNDLLPFEYEILIGKILCRCEYTLLSNKLSSNSFFSYWDSLDDLVQRAMEAIPQDKCNVSLTSFSDHTITTKLRRYPYIIAQRQNLTADSVKFMSVRELFRYKLDQFSTQSVLSTLSASLRDYDQSFNPDGEVMSQVALLSIFSSYALVRSKILPSSLASNELKRNQRSFRRDLTIGGSSLVVNDSSTTFALALNRTETAEVATNMSDQDVISHVPRRLLSSSDNVLPSVLDSGRHHQLWRNIEAFMPDTEDLVDESDRLGSFEQSSSRSNWTISEEPFSASKLFRDEESKEQLRSLQEREENSYKRWISIVQNRIEDGTSLLYIIGRHISLLSVKLAQRLLTKESLVISLITDGEAISTHQMLTRSRKLRNNLLCYNQLNISSLAAWENSPEKADIALVQEDVLIHLFVQVLSSLSPDDCSLR
jgi:hypothetical protein